MQEFNFNLPTKIIYGRNSCKTVNQYLGRDINSILITTDNTVALKTGIFDILKEQLGDKNLFYFTEVEPNPSFKTIFTGGEGAKKNNCQLVIGAGGGSCMDAAKGIAILATNEGTIDEYIRGKKIKNKPLPVVCIPTTSGTGSEVTPYVVFTDVKNKTKEGYGNDKIFPKISFIDPILTYSMPKCLIIDSGLDALTHAVEAYLSAISSPVSDIFALESIGIILSSLNLAVKGDQEAMDKMAYASMLAGIAITHGGTILLHVMGYPLTVYRKIPHGRANAILLSSFMAFMEQESEVGDRVGKIRGMFEHIGGLKDFVGSFDLPAKLSQYDINREDLEIFAKKVIVKSDVNITPARVTLNTILDIYESVL